MSRKTKKDSRTSYANVKKGNELFTPMYGFMLNSPAYIFLILVLRFGV